MVERFTREDGKIAVLILPEYGGGWSMWVSEEDEEVLLFDVQIVKAVLAGHHHTAASLAAMQTYRPRHNQSDSSDSESNESTDSEMTMETIIKNELDSTDVGAGSIDPAGMVDAIIKSLNTEPIDCSNFVARSESATNQFEGDASKIATVSETKTPVTIRSRKGKEWLDFCTDYDKIDPSYGNSYEYHVANCGFASAAPTLIMEWLKQGEEFYVNEYNVYETIMGKSN